MNSNGYREKDFDFTGVFSFLWRYKYPLIIVTMLAGICGLIFSAPYFIPPKYQSTVILYPTTTNSISNAILSTGPSKEDLLAFGEEEEAEQLLQILQSNTITKRIIEKYNLMEHYGIDPEVKYPNTELVSEFKDNINYRRTEYMSIEISVLDESRDTAALIANDIAALVDSTKNNVQRQRAIEAFKIVNQKHEEKLRFVRNMVDSLATLGELGVFNFEEQTAVLSEQYAIALSRKDPVTIKRLEEQMKILGKYGPAQQSTYDRLKYENEELANLKTKLEEARVDAEEILPASFIINYAGPAEKKAYPVRSLIVLISMLSALVLTIIVLLVFEQYRFYKLSQKGISDTVKIKQVREKREFVNL